jgi:hypothetical protein
MEAGIKQPTASQLRQLLKRHSLARQEAAALVNVSTSAWHKWTTSEDKDEHRKIPIAIYELLLLKLDEHPTKRILDK